MCDGDYLTRVTFRAPTEQVDGLEQLVENDVYPGRSEAIRAAVTDLLNAHDEPRSQRAVVSNCASVSGSP